MEIQHLKCALLNTTWLGYGLSSVFFRDILSSPLEIVQHDSHLRINFNLVPRMVQGITLSFVSRKLAHG